ncbi:MAG: alpha/beta hydrolase [Bacteroidales bacterium]
MKGRVYILIILIIHSFTGLFSQTRGRVNNILYTETLGDAYKDKMCRLDVSYLRNKVDLPVVVIFHGGGLFSGEKSIPAKLTLSNIIIVSANYRLSPQVTSPEYVKDAASVVKWVYENIENYGGDKSKIYISGESAGAYLAALVALDKSYLLEQSINADCLAGCFPISGQMTTHFTVMSERGVITDSSSPFIDDMAPLFHTRYTPFPIIPFIGGKNKDMPGRYEQNRQLAIELRSYGTVSALVEFAYDDHLSVYSSAYDIILPMIDKGCFVVDDTTYFSRPITITPELSDSIWQRAQIFDLDGISVENIDGYPYNYKSNTLYIYIYRDEFGRSFSRKISFN